LLNKARTYSESGFQSFLVQTGARIWHLETQNACISGKNRGVNLKNQPPKLPFFAPSGT